MGEDRIFAVVWNYEELDVIQILYTWLFLSHVIFVPCPMLFLPIYISKQFHPVLNLLRYICVFDQ